MFITSLAQVLLWNLVSWNSSSFLGPSSSWWQRTTGATKGTTIQKSPDKGNWIMSYIKNLEKVEGQHLVFSHIPFLTPFLCVFLRMPLWPFTMISLWWKNTWNLCWLGSWHQINPALSLIKKWVSQIPAAGMAWGSAWEEKENESRNNFRSSTPDAVPWAGWWGGSWQ